MQSIFAKAVGVSAITAALSVIMPLGHLRGRQFAALHERPRERAASTAGEIADRDILQLNTTMFELYGDAAQIFKAGILAEHPVILALFSGAGGRLILYRPGMAPLEAPSVPLVYQLLKSVGHSTMALAEVVLPYVDNPTNLSWRSSMQAYRSRMQSALDGLDASDMQADWRANNRSILQNNIAFMDGCLTKGAITFADLQAFSKQQGPLLKENVAWAAQTQVAHWMGVLDAWKKSLGSSWDKTYAASNTIYVARQNNVLFSVLAQYFGPEAINDRLMLIETVSFTTTPEDMLEVAHPHHRRPRGWRRVLRQLSSDGLRAHGWRRPHRHRGRECQAWGQAVPAAGGAVRVPSMAGTGHAWTGPGLDRGAALIRMARPRRVPTR